jgi:hypothetical protein
MVPFLHDDRDIRPQNNLFAFYAKQGMKARGENA